MSIGKCEHLNFSVDYLYIMGRLLLAIVEDIIIFIIGDILFFEYGAINHGLHCREQPGQRVEDGGGYDKL